MRVFLASFVFSILALSSFNASAEKDSRPGNGWYPFHPDSCACNELDRRRLGFIVAQNSGFASYNDAAVEAATDLNHYLVDGLTEHRNTGLDTICRAGVEATQAGWNQIKADYRKSGWDVGNYCHDRGSVLSHRN